MNNDNEYQQELREDLTREDIHEKIWLEEDYQEKIQDGLTDEEKKEEQEAIQEDLEEQEITGN